MSGRGSAVSFLEGARRSFSPLFRFFRIMRPSAPLSQPQAIDNDADDTDADDADLVRDIWLSLEKEENEPNLHNSSNTDGNHVQPILQSSDVSQVLNRDLRPDSCAQRLNGLNEGYDFDFSSGDYLEEKDLIDSASSSSCSENTCITPRNSEDLEASSHELETPGALLHTQGSRQLLIQPTASGSIGNCSNDMPTLHVEGTTDFAKSGFNPTHSTPVLEERSDRMSSKRGIATHEMDGVGTFAGDGSGVGSSLRRKRLRGLTQPIDDEASTFTNFVGTIARDSISAALINDTNRWHLLKIESTHNKEIRAQQKKMPCTAGTKSFSQLHHERQLQGEIGAPPTHVETFIRTHTHKYERVVDVACQQINEMNASMAELPKGSQNRWGRFLDCAGDVGNAGQGGDAA